MASSRFQDFLTIMDLNLDYLRRWRGKSESRSDQVTSAPIAALSATLDRDDPYPKPADFVPPLWHWLYFLPIHRQSELGPDGHAKRGGFLPPVPLPRRMFAGDRVQFHHPLRVGETVARLSRITDVNAKQGRSGPLVFVTVRHEISDGQGLALAEEHDIVYRDRPKPPIPLPRRKPRRKGQPGHAKSFPIQLCCFGIRLLRSMGIEFTTIAATRLRSRAIRDSWCMDR